jgi:hypothetical protein
MLYISLCMQFEFCSKLEAAEAVILPETHRFTNGLGWMKTHLCQHGMYLLSYSPVNGMLFEVWLHVYFKVII